ncbi:MAG TPA: hypothetical protein DDZ44_06200 [Syntrophomonas wolfei]|jgi:hypothetical protein|uniref:Uncharacterized protein n=1 Tax=Syntrophomonas wolfei TaxID=863 RepID=A0A354YZ45_9FIRM|nr:hypothetical protein [Syntrophomonas wolfei]
MFCDMMFLQNDVNKIRYGYNEYSYITGELSSGRYFFIIMKHSPWQQEERELLKWETIMSLLVGRGVIL